MLHEEMLHCRGQEKNKQVYVKECKCVVPTETQSESTHKWFVRCLLRQIFFFFLTQLQQTSPCRVLLIPCFLFPSSHISEPGRQLSVAQNGPQLADSPEQLFTSPHSYTRICQKQDRQEKKDIQIRRDTFYCSFLSHSRPYKTRKLLYLTLFEVLQNLNATMKQITIGSLQDELGLAEFPDKMNRLETSTSFPADVACFWEAEFLINQTNIQGPFGFILKRVCCVLNLSKGRPCPIHQCSQNMGPCSSFLQSIYICSTLYCLNNTGWHLCFI